MTLGIDFEGARGEIGAQLGDLRKEADRDKEMGKGIHQFRLQLRGGEGILSRRLLKRGHFESTEQLKTRILKFITFFNETLAKPFRWTYIGKPLVV